MIRNRTLSLAALALAGSAAWAWSQSPVEPPPAASGGAASSDASAEFQTNRELAASSDGEVLTADEAALSGDILITGDAFGLEAQPSGDILFQTAEPLAGTVREIRGGDGSRDVLWTMGAAVASPLAVPPPMAAHRFVHHPPTYTAIRSLRLSPEEVEQQQEIRKWTEVLHSDQSADEKEKARKALSRLLENQFSRDLERREKEVALLEERVRKLRTQVEKRKEAKAKIIDLRLDTIEQEAQGLGFPERATPRPASVVPGQPGQPFTIKLAPPLPPPGKPGQ